MIPLQDSQPLTRLPFWVTVIILVNLYVFYLELSSQSPEIFIIRYALIFDQIDLNDFYSLAPFISSQFLHAGFIHIISNMLFLWVFGKNVEVVFGFLFFPVFYLGSGIVAGLTQFLIMPQTSIPMLGASGAVAGVLGAYFALFPGNKIKTLVFIFLFVTVLDVPAYILLSYWFLTQFFAGVATISMSQADGGIAFLPHIGGFLFGWLVGIQLFAKISHLRFRALS